MKRKGKDITIPYPTEDHKKYIYALGRHRLRRLYDSVGGLDLDLETRPHRPSRRTPAGKGTKKNARNTQ